MIQTLGWCLLHFVWQGAAAAALLAMGNLLLRRAAPQARYLLASASLLGMLLLPVATFEVVRGTGASRPHWSEAPAVAHAALALTPVAITPDALTATGTLRRRMEVALPALVALWGAGVLLLSLRSLGGWVLVQRLRRSGLTTPPPAIQEALDRLVATLRVSPPVRLYESALVHVPTVVGWLRPVILLPASALMGLSPEQLELILAHELAHVRRADYLVNLVQTAAETVLFYHPAVWWVSDRMRVEREHCCDDLAVAACGNPLGYARALADLEALCPEAPAFAMAATGGSLLNRVARLVGRPPHLSRASRGLTALLACGSLALAVGVGSSIVGSGVSALPGASLLVSPVKAYESIAYAGAADPSPAPQGKPKAKAAADPKAEPRAFPLARVLEMARAGVTPEFIDEMDALGYPNLTVDQLIALRSQGVDPDYVRDLAKEGYPRLSADQLMMLRSQGVSPEAAREFKKEGLGDLSITDLVELQSQGVSPEFVAELKKAGYDGLSAHRLVALRSQGVDAEYVSELKALGYSKLPLSKLLALRAQGVDGEYVRDLKDAGYQDLPVEMLIALRSQGVDADFVREIKEAGFEHLKPEELIELRSQGVGGALLKRLRNRQ